MAKSFREVGMFSILLIIFMLISLVSSDITKDKEECANQLAGLATCLSYVGGQAKVPTQDCCTGLKGVLKDSKECLCILVRDRNDPSLGFKINATLALSLPQICHASSNVSECPALLHLPPNSPDAKVFTDFAKAAVPISSTTSASSSRATESSGTSAKQTSDGGNSRISLFTRAFYGVLLWSFYSFASLTMC